MSEKYGFIYVWRDRKHNRYYVGSHWGSEDDGYVCSSTWMRNAYKRRPDDFKRRIVARVDRSRNDLLIVEHRWLQMIRKEELGNKFYNLTNHLNGHWFASDEDRRLSISEKISKRTKEAMQRPEVREKYRSGLERRAPTNTPEALKKRSISMKKTMAKKFPVESRKGFGAPEFGSEQYRKNMAQSVAESWAKKDKVAIGAKISESLSASKEARSKAISALKWYNNGSINKRLPSHPGEGWNTGRI